VTLTVNKIVIMVSVSVTVTAETENNRFGRSLVDMSGGRLTCYKYSITCQDHLLIVDNAQSHVTAFRPISEAARSWSDDNRG